MIAFLPRIERRGAGATPRRAAHPRSRYDRARPVAAGRRRAAAKGTRVGRVYEAIDDSLRAWLEEQPLFFVATAPSGPDGHVNLSPKGARGSFRVLGPRAVAYLDLYGSGVETVAHLRQNGRIVLMFCAFAGPPKIVRLHGRGRSVAVGDPAFGGLLDGFAPAAETRNAARAVVLVDVERLSDSCGFVVPRMELVAERDQLFRAGEHRRRKAGPGWKAAYLAANNATSIDGLPGIDAPGQPPEGETVSPPRRGGAR